MLTRIFSHIFLFVIFDAPLVQPVDVNFVAVEAEGQPYIVGNGGIVHVGVFRRSSVFSSSLQSPLKMRSKELLRISFSLLLPPVLFGTRFLDVFILSAFLLFFHHET